MSSTEPIHTSAPSMTPGEPIANVPPPAPEPAQTPAPTPAEPEAPKPAEAPKTEAPKPAEAPKTEAPKPAEAPKTEAPKPAVIAPSGGSGEYKIAAKTLAELVRVPAGEQYASLGGVEGIAKSLNSDLENGIKASSISSRKQEYGENVLPKEEPVTFLGLLLEALSDKTILLLAFAACVAIIVGMTTKDPDTNEYHRDKGWIEGFAICISIIIVTGATTINDYQKEKKFQKLTDEGAKVPIEIRRDGKSQIVDISELLVGDICLIGSGLVLPCDGILIKGQSVVIDESAATGENDPKKKNAEHPFLLGTTTVCTAENAWMLVAAVGPKSFGGELIVSAMGDGERRPTPLQEKLDEMAEDIGKLGLAIALLLFIALSIIEIVQFATDDPDANGVDFLNYFIIAVSVVVVAVPEGLPLSVTIALAYSQKQMMEQNNQVRRLAACETMGNATQICSDKTGTLTQNLMSVKQTYIAGKHGVIENPGAILTDVIVDGLPASLVTLLCEGIALNSSSEKEKADGKWVWRRDKGNKTENGMLDYVDRVMKATYPDVDKKLPHECIRSKYAKNTFLFPFTSDRKRMSTLVFDSAANAWTTQHVKGASEKILELCDSYFDETGSVKPMSADVRKDIEGKILAFARDANRTIGCAIKTGLSLPAGEPNDEPSQPLTWIGVLGIQDPLRPEVKAAVASCLAAGVVVRMCTGDNKDTAVAISKECGIYNEATNLAMTGAEFREIVYRQNVPKFKGELDDVLSKMTVMARCQPLDKQLLVLSLMIRGEVVAVTGDGTNDAPALKLANVGFVMKSGTDVAVKAADIVLLDDNFRSVERALVWGRTVNDNIRKFLQFQLSVNVVCVALTFIGSLSAEGKFPLKAVQLLWVNLMMDTLAALSLSTEQPTEACLNRGPIQRQAPLISRRMWRFILTQAAYQITVTILLLHKAQDWFWVTEEIIKRAGEPEVRKLKFNIEHMTIVFNVFVYCVIFNEFNARKLYDEVNIFEGFGRSWFFVFIIFVMAGFQIFAVEVAGEFMKTTSLNWKQWLVCVAFGFGSWPLGFIARFIPITEPVYDKSEFDPEELDKESKKFYDKLEEDIKTHEAEQLAKYEGAAQAPAAGGDVPVVIPKEGGADKSAAAREKWQSAHKKVKSSIRVLGAIRRAHLEQNLKSSSAYGQYTNFKENHPSAY